VNDVASGLVVYPSTIEAAVKAELPFMATEEILMAGVKAGGDRQEMHERIRQLSQLSAQRVKMSGESNDLLARLAAEPIFRDLPLNDIVDARHFIGRAPEQVDAFIARKIARIRQRYQNRLPAHEELKV
jgi:adenylosuccinate lyase